MGSEGGGSATQLMTGENSRIEQSQSSAQTLSNLSYCFLWDVLPPPKFLVPLVSRASTLDFSLKDCPQTTGAHPRAKEFTPLRSLLTSKLSSKGI